jgi:hypothetical protein
MFSTLNREACSHVSSGYKLYMLYCNSELDRRVIENEQHFLFECHLYVDIRRANNLQPSNISDHTFVYVLSSTDPSKLWKLGKFVFEAFSHRKQYVEP